ncbi:MAG: HEAT repeat domain-containing protein [Gemmatimonadota bacterium]
MRLGTAVLAGIALAVPAGAHAQIAQAVDAMDRGVVRFSYDARPGVEICDQGVRMGDHHMRWSMRGNEYDATHCRVGVVEVDVRVRDGRVRDVDLTDERDRDRSVTDLGEVDPVDAADWLLGLAYGDVARDAAKDAILPAMLAEAPESWRGVLRLAEDTRLEEDLRKDALFWLGQAATDAALDGLTDVAMDDDEDQEIRNAAVFALSQRPDDEAVPILMELAETADEAETRRMAMFWLAQSDDPRVVVFFEEILLRGTR